MFTAEVLREELRCFRICSGNRKESISNSQQGMSNFQVKRFPPPRRSPFKTRLRLWVLSAWIEEVDLASSMNLSMISNRASVAPSGGGFPTINPEEA